MPKKSDLSIHMTVRTIGIDVASINRSWWLLNIRKPVATWCKAEEGEGEMTRL